MYESKLLSKAKWLLIPLMLLLMAISMIGFITPAKAAETNADTDVNLRDKVTETYIKEHVDSKYTSADKAELKNLILVKQTLFDGNKVSGSDTLDLLYDPINNFDKILGQFMTNVPVYNLSDNSDYYVAYVNTMQNNKNATIRDFDFAKNNDEGELVEGCILDKNTGLAYIPKSLFASSESGKEEVYPLQVQLMQVISGNTNDVSLQTCSATQKEDQSVEKGSDTFGDIYDNSTTATVEKGLDANHIAVFVNGVITPKETYNYNSETGEITVKGSPATINTITVEKVNDASKNVENQIFEDLNLETQAGEIDAAGYSPDGMIYTHKNPLTIPEGTKAGDYVDGRATQYYVPWAYSSMESYDVTKFYEQCLDNGTLHASGNFDGEIRNPFIRWVNDGAPDFMGHPGTYNDRAIGRQFMTDYADGKADFKFADDKSLDVTPLEQVNFACVHVEDPSLFSNVHNGQVYPASGPDVVQYKVEGVPMRMRFYKITDEYAVIGQIASPVRTMEGGTGNLSAQATLGMIKVPIQFEEDPTELTLSIEKDDESGAKLAGADMALYKDKVEGESYSQWNTGENGKNPMKFENIEAGKYILVEENAPEGFDKIDPIEFTLKDDGKVEITNDPSGKATVEQKDGTATLKAVDPKKEPPVKAEPNPGENKTVRVGDEVKYEVSQKNYKFKAADITITDHLDKGVDFVTADNGGHYDEATHTITWTIKNVASKDTAKVGFVVKVNDKAVELIENGAITKVGNDDEQETNIIRNPLPEPPVKTEPKPGEKETVKVGDEITYEISQKNYQFDAADITITDHLDEGVDFVTADNDGHYDEATHTITWTVKNVASKDTAKVSFVVKVNEKAVELIENGALTRVGNDFEQESTIIKNPLPEPPVKAEPTPGENEPVNIGDEVKYEVTQRNYKLDAADVVITDHLDERVDFVSADNDGHYDEATHTITWTLKNVPSRDIAKVGFVVKVNDKATEIIENQAITKVGNDAEQETNIIKNPLKTPVVKTEITPGEGKQVKVGDEVTYKVHFMNYRLTPETVVVTDRLDPGVDFVSADNNGTYDKANHMIVWTFKDMEARKEQDVTFKVKVNSKAGTVIRNQAEVQVGNDPVQKTNIIENPLAPGSGTAKGNAKTGVNGNNNLFTIAVIAVIALAVLGCGVFFINKKQKEDADKGNSEKQ